ncbi:DNA-directed RNA polymerase subunit beta [Bacillus sp. 1P06AnD]|uniref:DNA-directed RNA polymerase subunit beta n=1 Tax=Bacillus sp. 1P06AnD TaxID=3132208 RepID=UPI00399EEB1B
MEQEIMTRQDHHKVQEAKTKPEKASVKLRIRLIPIWLRIILFVAAVLAAVLIGCLVGYSVIGDGSPGEVFQKDTWTHIRDLVKQGS